MSSITYHNCIWRCSLNVLYQAWLDGAKDFHTMNTTAIVNNVMATIKGFDKYSGVESIFDYLYVSGNLVDWHIILRRLILLDYHKIVKQFRINVMKILVGQNIEVLYTTEDSVYKIESIKDGKLFIHPV